jgi:hypothetical protein
VGTARTCLSLTIFPIFMWKLCPPELRAI